MKQLHRAAARRAYRTLAQGLGSTAVVTAIAALATDGKAALPVAGIALANAVVTAFGSFWQGVAQGLPEATDAA